MLVLGDAHASEPENRAALLAAYRAAREGGGRVDDEGESVAIQVGDLQYYDLPLPTWFIAGNNEDLDRIDALRTGDAPRTDAAPDGRTTNAHLLASTAADIEGVTVAGLSGNYAPTKYDEPRANLEGDRRRHFTREDVEQLVDLGDRGDVDVDVLLTHEAPHGLLYLGYDPGSQPIDHLLDALEPSLCLVGHFHRHTVEMIGDAKAVALEPAWQSYYLLDPATLTLEKRDTPDVDEKRVPDVEN